MRSPRKRMATCSVTRRARMTNSSRRAMAFARAAHETPLAFERDRRAWANIFSASRMDALSGRGLLGQALHLGLGLPGLNTHRDASAWLVAAHRPAGSTAGLSARRGGPGRPGSPRRSGGCAAWIPPRPAAAARRGGVPGQHPVDLLQQYWDATAKVQERVRGEGVVGARLERRLPEDATSVDPRVDQVDGRAGEVGPPIGHGPVAPVHPAVAGRHPGVDVDHGHGDFAEHVVGDEARAVDDHDGRLRRAEHAACALVVDRAHQNGPVHRAQAEPGGVRDLGARRRLSTRSTGSTSSRKATWPATVHHPRRRARRRARARRPGDSSSTVSTDARPASDSSSARTTAPVPDPRPPSTTTTGGVALTTARCVPPPSGAW